MLVQVIKHLKFSGVMIEQQYEDGFERAILTFRHQRVYDPTQEEIVHLTEPPSELGADMDFLGPYPFFRSMMILSSIIAYSTLCSGYSKSLLWY